MRERLLGALWGSLTGDALALGVHWIYQQAKIAKQHGDVRDYVHPAADSYHPNKRKGDFTHYGDQTLWLLEALAADGWSLGGWAQVWQQRMPDYQGYRDGASKSTWAHLQAGGSPEAAGSGSNDLAGAGRIAPLLLLREQLADDALVAAAVAQTRMTHGDPCVAEAAAFFMRWTLALLDGADLEAGLAQAAAAEYATLTVADSLQQARDRLAEPTPKAQKALGLTCHLPEAFPATILAILQHPDDLEAALMANTMGGGDSAARGLLIGMVLGAKLGFSALPSRWVEGLNAQDTVAKATRALLPLNPTGQKPDRAFTFPNAQGEQLAGKLEWPEAEPRALALFAHCFTCGKDVAAASRISRALAKAGYAVLRFDFTGLGNSDGDFANTHFSSNVEDLVAAATALRDRFQAPSLLIGHSLGGAAVLAAGAQLPDVRAVATIGAPATPGHVSHLLARSLDEIADKGEAVVDLAGRSFRVKQSFVDDIHEAEVLSALAGWGKALLVLHSPVDETVNVDEARKVFMAARHPKGFLSLDTADHLLSRAADSEYAAGMIAAWATRYLA